MDVLSALDRMKTIERCRVRPYGISVADVLPSTLEELLLEERGVSLSRTLDGLAETIVGMHEMAGDT